MGSFEATYPDAVVRHMKLTEEELTELRELHKQLDNKFDEIATFMAKELALHKTDPLVREAAENAIEEWEDMEEEKGVEAVEPRTPFEQLLSEHLDLGSEIMSIRDEVIARSSDHVMKYRVGEVQSVSDGQEFHGVGFVLHDERGEPIVSFGYRYPADAAKARSLIYDAIKDAPMILRVGSFATTLSAKAIAT